MAWCCLECCRLQGTESCRQCCRDAVKAVELHCLALPATLCMLCITRLPLLLLPLQVHKLLCQSIPGMAQRTQHDVMIATLQLLKQLLPHVKDEADAENFAGQLQALEKECEKQKQKVEAAAADAAAAAAATAAGPVAGMSWGLAEAGAAGGAAGSAAPGAGAWLAGGATGAAVPGGPASISMAVFKVSRARV